MSETLRRDSSIHPALPALLPLVLCSCGAVVLACVKPDCCTAHTLRVIAACGRCTATGGMPVIDDDEPAP